MNFLKEKATKAMKALKALKPKDVRAISLVIPFAYLVLSALAAITHSLAVIIIAILFPLAGILFLVVFYRCPHCGKYLGSSAGKYCPHCGKELDK